MRASIGLAALMLLGACGDVDSNGKVKEFVSADFHDPASAQWRELKSVKAETGETWVCGEVNAKNLMGAYTGFRGFVANERQKLVVFEPGEMFGDNPLNARLGAVNYRMARDHCRERFRP